jgi:hypothetical protein
MGKLSDEFFMPPFSVLNAREGAWQKRKKEWISLGIKSELGRGEEGCVHKYGECAVIKRQDGTIEADGSKVLEKRNKNGLLGISEQARSHYNASPGHTLENL